MAAPPSSADSGIILRTPSVIDDTNKMDKSPQPQPGSSNLRQPTIKTFWASIVTDVHHKCPVVPTDDAPYGMDKTEGRMLKLINLIEGNQQEVYKLKSKCDESRQAAVNCLTVSNLHDLIDIPKKIGNQFTKVLKNQCLLIGKLRKVTDRRQNSKTPSKYLDKLWDLYGPLYKYGGFTVEPEYLPNDFNPYARFNAKERKQMKLIKINAATDMVNDATRMATTALNMATAANDTAKAANDTANAATLIQAEAASRMADAATDMVNNGIDMINDGIGMANAANDIAMVATARDTVKKAGAARDTVNTAISLTKAALGIDNVVRDFNPHLTQINQGSSLPNPTADFGTSAGSQTRPQAGIEYVTEHESDSETVNFSL